MKNRTIAIIGSGPAGLSAAMILAQANVKTVVFAGDKLGGQIMDASKINNCPGFQQNISGKQMIDLFYNQAISSGADILHKEVFKVNFSSYPFVLFSSDDNENIFDAVIIATGKKTNRISMAEKFLGRGVSYCAVCDGQFFKNKEVCVVGGGDSALKAALFLSDIAKCVHLFVRKNIMRASLENQKFVSERYNIFIHKNCEIIRINGDDYVTGIDFLENKAEKSMFIDGIFFMTGAVPATDIFEEFLKLDSEGYIITDEKCRTNIAGVFAAGDVQSGSYKQVPVAIGNAITAALTTLIFLQEKNK